VLSPQLTRYRLSQISLKDHEHGSSKSMGEAKKIMSLPAGDLPRINPQYDLKPHRFTYTLLNRGKSSFVDGIGKTDTASGTTIVWEQAKHTPGEPIFIPRPGAEKEDDGVVLSVVFDGDTAMSYLLCLNAEDLIETGRAVAPGPIGLGFHGMYVPNQSDVRVD
jgi:torulene dioxygenase